MCWMDTAQSGWQHLTGDLKDTPDLCVHLQGTTHSLPLPCRREQQMLSQTYTLKAPRDSLSFKILLQAMLAREDNQQ